MKNVDVYCLKSIDKISVKGGDIEATLPTSIVAPLGIGSLSADNITGQASLYIGAGEVKKVKVKGNVTPDITTDGGISKLDVRAPCPATST